MENLVKMGNSYFQSEFSESTGERISTFFNFADDEHLLCAVWTVSFSRYGFVVSDKALHWHLKTSDGIKSGGIQKNPNAEFLIFPYVSSENSAEKLAASISEECSRLEIRTRGRTEEFYIRGLSEEKGKTLCDILKFAFTQGELPRADLGELVKNPRFVLLRSFCDEVLNLANNADEKIKCFKENFLKAFNNIIHIKFKVKPAEKTEINSESKNTNFTEKKSYESEERESESDVSRTKTSSNDDDKKQNIQEVTSKNNFVISSILNLLDVCASIILILTVAAFLKRDLVEYFGISTEQFSRIGLAIYTILKCSFAFYSKKTSRKIIALILVFISILSYFLLSYTFTMQSSKDYRIFIIVLLVLCLLSYFAFEFSCGLKIETVFKKIVAIIVLGFFIYVTLCFTMYPEDDKKALIESARDFWTEISKFSKSLQMEG